MAEVKIAIYKTPSQAEKIGTSYTDSVSISKNDAIKLRDYYNDIEKGRVTTMGVISLCSPIVGKLLTASVATFLGTLTGASGLASSYFSQMGNKFQDLLDSMATKKKVTFVYRYKRHGSNDGAYWLVDIK